SASRRNGSGRRALSPCFDTCRFPKTAAHFWATCISILGACSLVADGDDAVVRELRKVEVVLAERPEMHWFTEADGPVSFPCKIGQRLGWRHREGYDDFKR